MAVPLLPDEKRDVMLSISDLKVGTIFKYDGAPYQVIRAQHVKMGRGGAVLQTKIKNIITGAQLDRNFKSAEKFEDVDLEKQKASFLYNENGQFNFMNSETYEQFFLEQEIIGEMAGFIKEGLEISVLIFEGKPVSIALPPKVELQVTQAPPGIKGDTAQGSVTKPVTLETGTEVNTPLFIKEGDTIRINTETGEYVERV